MAMGMTAVIITGGIDLSVGSVMALVAIVTARLLEAELPVVGRLPRRPRRSARWSARSTAALIAYVKLPPFVVTLGMLSIARSLAIVLSENRVIYQFGPGGDDLQGDRRRPDRHCPGSTAARSQLSNLFVVLLVLAVIVDGLVLKWTRLGPLHLRDRRQRERRAPDRHPGRSDQAPGLRVLRA